jgi:hypothetical protein
LATGRVQAGQIALGAGISRAAVAETGMSSEEAPGDTTDRALGPAAAAVPQAWGPAAAAAEASVAAVAEVVAVAAVGGAGKRPRSQKKIRWVVHDALRRPETMKISNFKSRILFPEEHR